MKPYELSDELPTFSKLLACSCSLEYRCEMWTGDAWRAEQKPFISGEGSLVKSDI